MSLLPRAPEAKSAEDGPSVAALQTAFADV